MYRNPLEETSRLWMTGVLLGLLLAGIYGSSAFAAGIDLTEVGCYDTPGSIADVVLIGHYAYVADGGGGLRVISFANPAAPVQKEVYPGAFNALSAEGNYDSGGAWAYVANAGRFSVMAIEHGPFNLPDNPNFYFNGEFGYCAINGSTITRIVHNGDHAFLAAYDAGLTIVNVSGATAPTQVGTLSWSFPFLHAKDVAVRGNYAYVSIVLQGQHSLPDTYQVSIVDVTTPASPSEVNTYSTPGTAESLVISGQYLYVADGSAGLRILSLSTPTAPVEVGHFSTLGSANQVVVNGNTAYVTEGSNGIRVIDVSNPASPVQLGFYTAAGSVTRVAPNGSYLGVAGGGQGVRLLTFLSPTLSAVHPDHALAGHAFVLSCQGQALGDVVALHLQNTGHTLTPESLLVSGNTLSAVFSNPQPAGRYDLVLSINNVLSQGNMDYVFKNRVTLLTPASGPQTWQVTDLGKAGNPVQAKPGNIAIVDADRDQKNEIYIADNDRAIVRFKKDTDWSVSYLQELTSATYQHLLAADGNRDRDWELYLASTKPETSQLLMNSTWQGNSLSSYSGAMAFGDADHDGVNEVYLAGNTTTGISLAGCSFNGSVWTTRTIEGASYWFGCLAIGDGNQDQAAEIYAANHDHYLYQYQYNGTSWLRSVVATVGNGQTLSMLIDDLDHDGQQEIYTANQEGKLYQIHWTGSGWSTPLAIHSGSLACNQITAADGNNDGQDEIYGAGQDGHAYQLGLVGSSWQVTDLGNAGTSLTAIAVGDGDNNNQAEVYALGENAHLYQFQAFPSSPTPTPPATPTRSIAPLPDRFLKIFNSQINPTFGQKALIRWSQPMDGPVTIRIYNLQGDCVLTLKEHVTYSTGVLNEVSWEGKNTAGNLVASGIYIVLLQAPAYQAQSKICVMK